jgi:hypothetical protein
MQTPSSKFANHFFQVGLGDDDLKSRILNGKPEIELNLGGLFGGGTVDVHPMDYHYTPKTLFRYPQEDTEQLTFPPYLSMVLID